MFKLPENLGSKYEFVTLASKRAEQLQGGAMPRVEEFGRKVTVVAQREVAEGAVGVWDPEMLEQTVVVSEEVEEE